MTTLALLAKDRRQVVSRLIEVFDAAAQPIQGDPAVWDEEGRCEAPVALPWPVQARGEGYEQLLRILFASTVDNILDAIEVAHGAQRVPPEDPTDKDFQRLLRVAKRATDAGDAALRQEFGGADRLSIKRELMNIVREQLAQAAVDSGRPLRETFEAAGLSKTAAYKALQRRRQRE